MRILYFWCDTCRTTLKLTTLEDDTTDRDRDIDVHPTTAICPICGTMMCDFDMEAAAGRTPIWDGANRHFYNTNQAMFDTYLRWFEKHGEKVDGSRLPALVASSRSGIHVPVRPLRV